jgi:flagellar basal body-associated protein FliL
VKRSYDSGELLLLLIVIVVMVAGVGAVIYMVLAAPHQ